jgi:alkaline phosphatase
VNPNILASKHNDFMFPATVPAYVETHGGDDVGVWAIGAQAHEFRGVIEQNVIAQTMAKAACVGAFKDDCDN